MYWTRKYFSHSDVDYNTALSAETVEVADDHEIIFILILHPLNSQILITTAEVKTTTQMETIILPLANTISGHTLEPRAATNKVTVLMDMILPKEIAISATMLEAVKAQSAEYPSSSMVLVSFPKIF